MPDASLFEPVCELLDITLTELFCGEKIEQTQIVAKAEESMAATVDYAEKTVKRQNKRLIAVIAAFAVTLVGILVLLETLYFTPCASHPGDVSQWQGLFPAHSEYLLALNDEDKPVFADPAKALAQAKVDYSDAIRAVKSEHRLLPLSRYYYNAYGVFGWQIVTAMICSASRAHSFRSLLTFTKTAFAELDFDLLGAYNATWKRGNTMHDDLTKQDIAKMQAELDERNRLMPELIEEVKRTRAFGDLSENFEYKEAKRAKNRNGSRIRYLENMIKSAHIIDSASAADEVGLYDKVEIYIPEDDETQVIQVVTTIRTDPLKGLISRESPFGKAVLGKKVGDSFTVFVNDNYSYDAVIRSIIKSEDDGSAPILQY